MTIISSHLIIWGAEFTSDEVTSVLVWTGLPHQSSLRFVFTSAGCLRALWPRPSYQLCTDLQSWITGTPWECHSFTCHGVTCPSCPITHPWYKKLGLPPFVLRGPEQTLPQAMVKTWLLWLSLSAVATAWHSGNTHNTYSRLHSLRNGTVNTSDVCLPECHHWLFDK